MSGLIKMSIFPDDKHCLNLRVGQNLIFFKVPKGEQDIFSGGGLRPTLKKVRAPLTMRTPPPWPNSRYVTAFASSLKHRTPHSWSSTLKVQLSVVVFYSTVRDVQRRSTVTFTSDIHYLQQTNIVSQSQTCSTHRRAREIATKKSLNVEGWIHHQMCWFSFSVSPKSRNAILAKLSSPLSEPVEAACTGSAQVVGAK